MKILILPLLLGVLFGQATPVDIPKKELPKKALCILCSQQGENTEEKPVAGVRYKGTAYYFCNASEVKTFKNDPEGSLPLPLPRPVPEFALKSLTGEKITQETWKGKVVLLDFWATWCKPCVKAMPEMQKLHQKFAGKGFSVLGISIDEKGEKVVRPFIEKRKFTYPILLDTDETPVWKAFRVRTIPALFLINREGNIVKQWVGEPDKKEIEKAVADLLKE